MHFIWTDFIFMTDKGNTLGAFDGSVDTVNPLKAAVLGCYLLAAFITLMKQKHNQEHSAAVSKDSISPKNTSDKML